MCLILFAYKAHPRYPLVVAANRDEAFSRPTQPVHWWSDRPALLAGKDLEGGGTWLGITRSGDFAALTNVRSGTPSAGKFSSRGELPLLFLDQQLSTLRFVSRLQESRTAYRGYNLLFGHYTQLQHYSNATDTVTPLQAGIHGLSNATLDTPWPKVAKGKKRLAEALRHPEPDPTELLTILEDRDIAPDQQLPATGISLELERQLSPAFIHTPNYGTRSSCLLLIDQDGQVSLLEKERAPREGSLLKHQFRIETKPVG